MTKNTKKTDIAMVRQVRKNISFKYLFKTIGKVKIAMRIKVNMCCLRLGSMESTPIFFKSPNKYQLKMSKLATIFPILQTIRERMEKIFNFPNIIFDN